MHQDLHGLHVDDGDQLGPVELLVAVLCQAGRACDDTKATVTAGNFNKLSFKLSFAVNLISMCQQKSKNELNVLFLTRRETFQRRQAVDVCVDSGQSLAQRLFIHHVLFFVQNPQKELRDRKKKKKSGTPSGDRLNMTSRFATYLVRGQQVLDSHF